MKVGTKVKYNALLRYRFTESCQNKVARTRDLASVVATLSLL